MLTSQGGEGKRSVGRVKGEGRSGRREEGRGEGRGGKGGGVRGEKTGGETIMAPEHLKIVIVISSQIQRNNILFTLVLVSHLECDLFRMSNVNKNAYISNAINKY